MKAFTLSTLALLLGACPLLAQSTTVDVEVTLATPGASCAFTVSNDLEFGTVQKPTTGTGTVTIAATTGVRTSNGAVVSGTSTVGQVRLVGSHTADYTVSRTFPTSLDNGSESLTFTGSWAESTSATSGYTAITTSSYTGTAGGAGTSFSRYFRFGGSVGDIAWSNSDGDYTGSITTSASCN